MIKSVYTSKRLVLGAALLLGLAGCGPSDPTVPPGNMATPAISTSTSDSASNPAATTGPPTAASASPSPAPSSSPPDSAPTSAASTAVSDNTVSATATNPDQAEDLIEAAFAQDTTLAPFDLDADTQAGEIELTGVVQTDDQKAHAEDIARQIAPGITIDNRIRVDQGAANAAAPAPNATVTASDLPTPATADQAEDYVDAALTIDDTLRGFDLDADEENGGILLKGTVQTDDQKARAEQIAKQYAPGFTIDNQIKVDANASPRAATPANTDHAEDMIEAAYTLDATLRVFNLDVKHSNNTVTLLGTVQTDDQRAHAEAIAKQYAGSFAVDNQIKVQ